jgi:hypothetical protein
MKLAGRHIQVVPVGIALVLLWLLHRTVLWLRFHRKYNFPNLVPGVPLFGNMLQIPTDTAGRRLYLHKLARKYGEMYVSQIESQQNQHLQDFPHQVHTQGRLQLLDIHELSARCQ